MNTRKKNSYMLLSVLFFISLFASPINADAIYNKTLTPQAIENHANPNNTKTIAYHLNKMSQNGGGTLTLKNGVYKVKNSLIVPANVVIKGESEEGTIIQFKQGLNPSGGTHIIKSKDGQAKNIELRNFTVRAKQKYNAQTCIYLTGNRNIESGIIIRNVTANDCGQHGIHIKNAKGAVLKYITLNNNGLDGDLHHNMYLRRVDDSSVEFVTSKNAKANGFNASQINNLLINYYTANNNGQHGIRVARSRNVKIKNSTANNNQDYGITFYNEGKEANGDLITNPADKKNYNGSVIDSKANNNKRHGVYIRFTEGFKIQGTEARYNDKYGFVWYKTSNITKSNNNFNPNGVGTLKEQTQ